MSLVVIITWLYGHYHVVGHCTVSLRCCLKEQSRFTSVLFASILYATGTPSTNETAIPATVRFPGVLTCDLDSYQFFNLVINFTHFYLILQIPGNIGQSEKVMSLRPLSPHLPIYKPQSSSMLSITHRITSVYLVGVVLAYSVIFLQMGKICLTSFPFYQFCCYVAKLTPITMELAALALAFNIFHILARFGGRI